MQGKDIGLRISHYCMLTSIDTMQPQSDSPRSRALHKLKLKIAAINATLDNEASGYAPGCLPPYLRDMDAARAVGRFADMITFTKSSYQQILNWRNCDTHKRRLEQLDLRNAAAAFSDPAFFRQELVAAGLAEDTGGAELNGGAALQGYGEGANQQNASQVVPFTEMSHRQPQRMPSWMEARSGRQTPIVDSRSTSPDNPHGTPTPAYHSFNHTTLLERTTSAMGHHPPSAQAHSRSPYTGQFANAGHQYSQPAPPRTPIAQHTANRSASHYIQWNNGYGGYGRPQYTGHQPQARAGSAQAAIPQHRSQVPQIHGSPTQTYMPQAFPQTSRPQASNLTLSTTNIDPRLLSPPKPSASRPSNTSHMPTLSHSATASQHGVSAAGNIPMPVMSSSQHHASGRINTTPAYTSPYPPTPPNDTSYAQAYRAQTSQAQPPQPSPTQYPGQFNAHQQPARPSSSQHPGPVNAPNPLPMSTSFQNSSSTHTANPTPATSPLIQKPIVDPYVVLQRELDRQRELNRQADEEALKQLQAEQREYRERKALYDAYRTEQAQKEQRKAELQEELRHLLRTEPDAVLAHRYRDYVEAFPLPPGEKMSSFHLGLLANEKMPEEGDMRDHAVAVRYAKAKWWNYWELGDVGMVAEMARKARLSVGEETKMGGHLVTKEDLESMRRLAKLYHVESVREMVG